jgi:hypothetical protein
MRKIIENLKISHWLLAFGLWLNPQTYPKAAQPYAKLDGVHKPYANLG